MTFRAAVGLYLRDAEADGRIATGGPVNRTSDVSAAPSEELFFLWAWLGRQMDAIEAYKEAFSRA